MTSARSSNGSNDGKDVVDDDDAQTKTMQHQPIRRRRRSWRVVVGAPRPNNSYQPGDSVFVRPEGIAGIGFLGVFVRDDDDDDVVRDENPVGDEIRSSEGEGPTTTTTGATTGETSSAAASTASTGNDGVESGEHRKNKRRRRGDDDGNRRSSSRKKRSLLCWIETNNKPHCSRAAAVLVKAKRLLPAYTASSMSMHPPNGALSANDVRTSEAALAAAVDVLVVAKTDRFRQLAASELCFYDGNGDDAVVVEIGCSTGETSSAIWRYGNKWVGFDTSEEMVEATRKRMENEVRRKTKTNNNDGGNGDDSYYSVHRIDPLVDSDGALRAIGAAFLDDSAACRTTTDDKDRRRRRSPTAVFVDIGGSRELDGVLRMLDWVFRNLGGDSDGDSSSSALRLVVVKSERLAQSLKSLPSSSTDRTSESANGKMNGRGPGGEFVIEDADDWFERRMDEIRAGGGSFLPKHPLRAPLRLSPADGTTPICRYHNYHPEGCTKQQQASSSSGSDKNKECPYDHRHCHFCLEPGHVARTCPAAQVPTAKKGK